MFEGKGFEHYPIGVGSYGGFLRLWLVKESPKFEILEVEQVCKTTSSLTMTLNVWGYQELVEIRIPTGDNFRQWWGKNS